MQPKTPKLLEDIRDAATFISEATRGKTLEDYRHNRLLRQAVERNFEIIGEAIRRLEQIDLGVTAQISNSRQIVDFRNILSTLTRKFDDVFAHAALASICSCA